MELISYEEFKNLDKDSRKKFLKEYLEKSDRVSLTKAWGITSVQLRYWLLKYDLSTKKVNTNKKTTKKKEKKPLKKQSKKTASKVEVGNKPKEKIIEKAPVISPIASKDIELSVVKAEEEVQYEISTSEEIIEKTKNDKEAISSEESFEIVFETRFSGLLEGEELKDRLIKIGNSLIEKKKYVVKVDLKEIK